MNYKSLLILLLVSFSLPVWANKTPSDVYQVTEQIILEVQHLRNNLGTTGTPRIPDVQVYKTPLHVFAKSLEVLEKIAKFQQANGLISHSIQNIPLKPISPDDVYQQSKIILQQVMMLQEFKNMSSSAIQAPLLTGKTPSNVYENLWKVSFMLDALLKKTTPTDVYNNVSKANAEINDVAQQKNVPISSVPLVTDPKTTPSQVLLQGYLNLHQIVGLEKKLGLKPFRVPSFPKGKITPSDVYDSTSMLIAELTRIKIHLNLKNNLISFSPAIKKTPADVLSIMLMAEQNIHTLNINLRK